MTTKKSLAAQLREQSAQAASSVTIGALTVYVNFPPLSKFQLSQERADIHARRELKDIEADLKAMPIDEKEYDEALKAYEGQEPPKKPANKYEQRLEQERNTKFMFIIGPYMLFRSDGSKAHENEEDRASLRSAIEESPDLIKAISDKMKEFGEAMAAKTDDKKK